MTGYPCGSEEVFEECAAGILYGAVDGTDVYRPAFPVPKQPKKAARCLAKGRAMAGGRRRPSENLDWRRLHDMNVESGDSDSWPKQS